MVAPERLARMISGEQSVSAPGIGIKQGQVSAVAAGPPPTLTLTLSGSTTPIAGVRLTGAGYYPVAGDVVLVLMNGPDPFVIGPVADGFDHSVRPGTVFWDSVSSIPIGRLAANGQAVSRTIYARVFSFTGTTHGAGDGSTTFNVVNLTGRVPIGSGTLGSDTYTLGGSGGEARHTLTGSEEPAHFHELDMRQISEEASGHGTKNPADGFANRVIVDASTAGNSRFTNTVGGGGAHENRPPYRVLTPMIST